MQSERRSQVARDSISLHCVAASAGAPGAKAKRASSAARPVEMRIFLMIVPNPRS